MPGDGTPAGTIKELRELFKIYDNKYIEFYDKADFDDTIRTFQEYENEIQEIQKLPEHDQIEPLNKIMDKMIVYLENKKID